MRFGDRIRCSTPKLSRERWKKYWDHLDEIGFSKNDPLYRFFGGEVFHDGEIAIDQIRLTDAVVVLQLRNVHAVNEVDRLLRSRKGKKAPKLNRADFQTKVTFRGVKRLEINFRNTPHDALYYHCAELDRLRDYISIKLYFTNFDEKLHWIKLIFESIEMEDIGRRLRRYLSPDVRVEDIISHVKQGKERAGSGQGLLPGAPTDPYVRHERIRLVKARVRVPDGTPSERRGPRAADNAAATDSSNPKHGSPADDDGTAIASRSGSPRPGSAG